MHVTVLPKRGLLKVARHYMTIPRRGFTPHRGRVAGVSSRLSNWVIADIRRTHDTSPLQSNEYIKIGQGLQFYSQTKIRERKGLSVDT